MSKSKCLFLATLLVLAPLTLAVAQAQVDVSGEWNVTVTTPNGERTSTAKFVQEGEKLTVTMTNQRGESTGTGTIKGNAIEWTVTADTPRGKVTRAYKGTVDGNTMKGEVQMGDRGSMEWKATKKTA
jgi:hypothetical protein